MHKRQGSEAAEAGRPGKTLFHGPSEMSSEDLSWEKQSEQRGRNGCKASGAAEWTRPANQLQGKGVGFVKDDANIDLMYSVRTIVNNSILWPGNLLKVDCRCFHHTHPKMVTVRWIC